MRVVHCKKQKYDIYIGRGKCPIKGKASCWGNPFKVGINGTREEVIDQYRDWVQKQPWLERELDKLLNYDLVLSRELILGCWCDPLPCHGKVIIVLAYLRKHELAMAE